MNEKKLCPNCGAPITNSTACAYCGSMFASDIHKGISQDDSYSYDNPVLEKILERAIDLQKIHGNIIVDIMEYYGGLGGYAIQVLISKENTPMVYVALENSQQVEIFSSLPIYRMFIKSDYTKGKFQFYRGSFGIDPKWITTVISQIYKESFNINIESLGYHIWCQYISSSYNDEYFDNNGELIPATPIQNSIRLYNHKINEPKTTKPLNDVILSVAIVTITIFVWVALILYKNYS